MESAAVVPVAKKKTRLMHNHHNELVDQSVHAARVTASRLPGAAEAQVDFDLRCGWLTHLLCARVIRVMPDRYARSLPCVIDNSTDEWHAHIWVDVGTLTARAWVTLVDVCRSKRM